MSTRSTRRPQPQPLLTPLEALLLAQAAWQLGAGSSSWSAIAKLLSKHPLLSRPKSFFTAQSCHAMYEQLMKDAALDLNDSNDNPHAPMNLKLAEKHYRSRHTELRDLILTEESKFKTILKEIEDIRAGLWDKKIQAKLSGAPEPDTSVEPPKENNVNKCQPPDEGFDGSELSGVTESTDSSSSRDEIPTISTAAQNELQEVATPTRASEQEAQQEALHDTTNPSSPPLVVELAEGSTEEVAQDEVISHIIEQVQSKSPSPSPATPKESITVIPATLDLPAESVHDAIDLQQNDVHMEDQALELMQSTEEPIPNAVEQQNDQKEEEEEEENNQDDDTKEEEEEASQGQPDDIEMETDHGDGENRNFPKSSEQVESVEDLERNHTPAPEATVSEVEPAEEDHSSASEEEPVLPARRSTRQRKTSIASVPFPTTRKRLRSQARLSESEPQKTMDSENENENENEDEDEDTPQPEDEASSPFDGATIRRRDGKRKASFMDSVDSPIDKKRMREDSEPVDEDEPGPSSHNTRARITRHGTRTEEQVALKRFQNVIGMLHSQISQHRNGNIFHNPIKNSEAPDYHEIVKRPMDLKTIKTRVKDGLIANSLEFQRDIFLMFANSMMYNRPGSDVYSMAEDMMLESEGQIIAFRQTEGLVKRGQRQT